jgi:cytochrome P450
MINGTTVQDMFLGGTDTSTIAVEWGLAELVRHPSAMKRLQEELDSVVVGAGGRLMGEEDIARLPYLQAVVKEVLRLHPVAPLMIPHESTEPCEVGGFYVAEGTRLIVNVFSLSMDERHWENPSKFLPERFLDSEVDLRGHHFQFLPFGAGRRACPAINLGLLNIYLMLGALLQCFQWTLPPSVLEIDMSEAFDITLHMINPLVLTASPRLSTEFYLSLTNQ